MADDVEVRELPEVRVAYLRHVGPYGSPSITEMWRRLRAWCASEGLARPMFGIAQDNPNITPPDRTRYDACVEIGAGFQPQGELGVQTLRGGRHACVPFTGTAAEIRAAWIRFLTRTLPDAGLEPDLVSALEIYAPDFAIDPETGAFSCTLCMPLRGT